MTQPAPGTGRFLRSPDLAPDFDAFQRIGGFGAWSLELPRHDLHLSAQAASILGASPSPAPATLRHLLDCIDPEDRHATELAFGSLIEDGEPLDLVRRVRSPDGTSRRLRIRGEVSPDPDGRITRALGTVQDTSREHVLHTALRASEARLGSILEAMTEGVAVQDAEGRMIDANEAACRILGLTRDQLLGRTSIDPRWEAVREDGTAYPGEVHPAMIALRTGEAVKDRLMGVSAPGFGQRWISITSVPIADEGRHPHAVVSTFVDVTDRRDAQRRLTEKAARLRDLYDHAPCGYHSIDSSGRFVEVNETELAWLGCSRAQVVGRLGPADFLDEDGRARLSRGLARLVDGEPEMKFEIDLHGRDGTVRRVAGRATAVRDASGAFVMSRTVLHDVTELRRVERALRRITIEQQLMLDNDLIGIVKLHERRATWINRAMARIFGYEKDELDGRPSRMLYGDEATYRRVGEEAGRTLSRGERCHLQLQMVRKDGSPVWIDLNGVQMPGDAGESLWILADVSESRRAEQQRLVAERLSAENRHLMSVNLLKSRFLSSMSHELRTPLSSIVEFTDLIRSGVIPSRSSEFDEFFRYVGTSGRHLLRMIETILGFAASPGALSVFEPADTRIDPLVREVVRMLEREALAKDIAVETEIDARLGVVRIDPFRLKQVLHAYLSNAVRFTPPGGRVSIRAIAAGGESLRIEVEDTGVGIEPADLPRLFEASHPADARAAERSDGLGMGLMLSRSLVEAQGGEVGVRSEPGVGSVFHAVLPIGPGPATGPLSRPAPPTPASSNS